MNRDQIIARWGESHSEATRESLIWFAYDHITEPEIRGFSQQCYDLAANMCDGLPDHSPQLRRGLHRLLEAKDCFVRAAVEQAAEVPPDPPVE